MCRWFFIYLLYTLIFEYCSCNKKKKRHFYNFWSLDDIYIYAEEVYMCAYRAYMYIKCEIVLQVYYIRHINVGISERRYTIYINLYTFNLTELQRS